MRGQPAIGRDVYHWPEFKAFAQRLGFAWDAPNKDLAIIIPMDGPVTIYTESQGIDAPPLATLVKSPITALQERLDMGERSKQAHPLPALRTAVVRVTYHNDNLSGLAQVSSEEGRVEAKDEQDAENRTKESLDLCTFFPGVYVRSIDFVRWQQ